MGLGNIMRTAQATAQAAVSPMNTSAPVPAPIVVLGDGVAVVGRGRHGPAPFGNSTATTASVFSFQKYLVPVVFSCGLAGARVDGNLSMVALLAVGRELDCKDARLQSRL